MKHTIRLILAILLALTLFSVTAAAEENTDVVLDVGTTGSTVTMTDEMPAETPDENQNETPNETPSGDPAENLPSDSEGTPSDAGSETEVIPSDTPPTDNEEPDDSTEYVLSGSNIPVVNGTYNYELVIRPPDRLTFDNDLENFFQGVFGKYQLHYAIEELDNHIMTATGLFKNILTASPLVIFCKDAISEDSYFYQLDLRTKEGFSFINNLQYLFNGEQHGYSIYYDYDLLTNEQTFEIGEPRPEEVGQAFRQQKNPLQKIQSLFSRILSFLKW